MKERNFVEWIIFFCTVNFIAFTIVMFFVPAYPWWFFLALAILSGYVAPHFLKGKSSNRSSNRYKF